MTTICTEAADEPRLDADHPANGVPIGSPAFAVQLVAVSELDGHMEGTLLLL